MWNLEKENSQQERSDWWLPGQGVGVGEMAEAGQRVQTSVINKLVRGCNVRQDDGS